MAELGQTFSRSIVVQSLSASTPEALSDLINKIRVPYRIINFVAVPGTHTVYFTSNWKIKISEPKKQITVKVGLPNG